MKSFNIWAQLLTYLVQEFELIPIPFFKAQFIDLTGEVVIASNDIGIFEHM